MSSRLLSRSAPLLVLAVVALGLLCARPADPPADEAAGPVIVARAIDRTSAAARPAALAVLAAAAVCLVAGGARPDAPAPVTVARARSEALSALRRRGPPAGRAR